MKRFSKVRFLHGLYKKNIRKKDILFWFLAICLALVPVGMILIKIFTGAFPFWYDPARDMVSGLDNFLKPTLIGPTSGIPGIFYGPYWIWLLSFGQLFSKGPRVVDFIVLTIPYLVIFPIVLKLFKNIFSTKVAFLLWLLFILGFTDYAFYLWNPNPAPLIFLIFVLLLLKSDFDTKMLKSRFLILVTSFVLGFLVNFHLSFGIGVVFGTMLYFIWDTIFGFIKLQKRTFNFFSNRILNGLVLVVGFLLSFSPFMLFELRHNFSQTKTFINAFSHFGAVVSTSGLTHYQMVNAFLGRLATLFDLPVFISVLIFVIAVIIIVIQKNRGKIVFSVYEKKLIAILVSITIGVLTIYFSAKNPVWEYHFISVEIIFLLAIGIIVSKFKSLKILLFLYVFLLTFLFVKSPQHTLKDNPKNVSGNLVAEEQIVKKINNDAAGSVYTVFVYSPSIYSYEYSYLFRVMYEKNVPYRPELNPTNSKLVYIVFPPKVKKAIFDDFIHYRTPPSDYTTTKQFEMSDKSIILKRIRN